MEKMDWNWKSFWQVVGVLFVVGLVLTVFSFVFGWITLPIQKGGAGNVEQQFTYGYQTIKALQSTARSVCLTQKAYDAETDPSLKSQRQTQLLGYQSNYSRLEGEYDAWAANIFQGKVIRPSDLPQTAPSLGEMQSTVCTTP